MFKVTYLTDSCLALKTDNTNLARRKTNLRCAVFFCHKLCESTCRTNKLCALTGVEFNVVNDSTNRNVGDRKHVTGLDIRIRTSGYYIAVGKTYGSYDVALFAFSILKKCDVCGSVGVVLDTDNGSRAVFKSLEIDYSVLLFVAAAVVTNGDLTVAVTAGMLFLGSNKALLGRELSNLIKEGLVIPLRDGVVGLYFIVAIV
jgi:hypothetical protein